MSLRNVFALVIATACFAGSAQGAAIDDARGLRNEGLALVKKAREGGDPIKDREAAIVVFEKAMSLLEGKSGAEVEKLQTDINSLLFWTRRTMPMKFDGSRPVRPLTSSGGGSSTSKAQSTIRRRGNTVADAQAALNETEQYARNHPNEYLTITARFFEVADTFKQHKDIAFKAIARAQYFQRLESGGSGHTAEEKDTGPGADLVAQGDRAHTNKKYEEATQKYEAALSQHETASRRRKLGQAQFSLAQHYKDEYIKKNKIVGY